MIAQINKLQQQMNMPQTQPPPQQPMQPPTPPQAPQPPPFQPLPPSPVPNPPMSPQAFPPPLSLSPQKLMELSMVETGK